MARRLPPSPSARSDDGDGRGRREGSVTKDSLMLSPQKKSEKAAYSGTALPTTLKLSLSRAAVPRCAALSRFTVTREARRQFSNCDRQLRLPRK